MASCIHPSCSCKAYQEPKREKGTLLQLRRGCVGCKHHAFDHRQLTTVDRLIETEVTAAAGNKCTQLIPVSEIPQSPLFGPHDLIPLPIDDTPSKESGVPCACVGFQVAAIVSLWQKFRTYSVNDAMSAVPQTTCSLCQHPLLSHQAPGNGSSESLGLPNSEKGVSSLVLKSAAKVDFVPVSGNCVQFIPPGDARGSLTFLALVASDPAGSSLLLWVCSRPLSLREKQEEGDERGREKGDEKEESGEMANEKNPAISKSDGSPTLAMKPLDSLKSESAAIPATCSVVDLTIGDEISSPVVEDKKSKKVKSPKKRGRKRKQTVSVSTGSRKSARIAAKKQDTAGKKLRLDVIYQLKDISLDRAELHSGSVNGMPAALDCQKKAAEYLMALRENMAAFVDSLEKKENCISYKLPEAIPSTGFEVMAATATCCLGPATGKEEALLVALGGEAGEVFVWAPASGLQCTPLEHSCRILRLCWQELPPATSEATSGAFLCVGGSCGALHVWHVQLQVDSQRIQCQSYPIEGKVDVPTRADITACSWAPNGKFLAAGSLFGEVLVYAVPSCEHVQTLRCCRAPVTCFAWSADCSMLAVGGGDDCVQVLQCSRPPLSTQTHPRNSILKYMKVDPKSRKYIHTHSFTGHQSFIGSLTFLGSGTGTNTLVSIGWDSQILLWQIQSSPDYLTNSRSRGHGRNQPNLPSVDTEPQCGYKVGPSASAEFLPIALHVVPGCGLVTMLVDKFGAITIANYHYTLR